MTDMEQFQTKNLFLLIGTNPLPNYVAAKLLLKQDGRLYLAHTDETSEIADRLIAALGVENDKAVKFPVKETESNDIFDQVSKYAKDKQDVGLNYTGGTKTMAVHTYRAIERVCPEAVFSYLDARTLEMPVEKAGIYPRRYYVGTKVNLSIKTMLSLHDVTYDEKKVQTEPLQAGLASALARLHTTKVGAQTWWEWRRKKSQGWTVLPKGEPGLEEVERELGEMCGDREPTPELVADALECERLLSCASWFKGDWLENYTLYALKQVVEQRDDIHDYGMDFHCTGQDARNQQKFTFQFDVAAMRGYQLFALSCIASDQKDKCKEHLFEAYVRARQMGGDEARVALVCAYRDTKNLLAEIEKPWDAEGKLQIFGAKHLPKLSDYLSDWFNSQP